MIVRRSTRVGYVGLVAALVVLAACRTADVSGPQALPPTHLSAPKSATSGDLAIVPQVSVGVIHTCALKADGTVVCWGENSHGQATVPAGLDAVAEISGGGNHTCALKTGGTVVCWGYNWAGEATVPSGLGAAVQVSAGWNHTCALKADGTVTCWGLNWDGQTTVPDGLGSVAQVSAGSYHTCALKTDATVVCWGTTSGTGMLPMPSGLSSVVQVSAGNYHTCTLKVDGTVVCWGGNWSGEATVPAALGPFAQVSAGLNYTCALKTNGTVVCWGSNGNGQLAVPAGLSSVSQVSARGWHACALKTGGTVVCWGYNVFGQTDVPAGLNLIVSATNQAPVASAGGPYAGSEGAAVSFDGSHSTDPDGNALTYSWSFGDGTPAATGATPTHAYSDDGTYTVMLTVSDGTASTTARTTATIANVAPTLGTVAGATILPGETFSSSGTFADPGLDTWTATVDYGDGSGTQALVLSGKTFALNQVYRASGTYSVTVTVTDDDGGTGAGHTSVFVQSPQQALQAVLGTIVNLVASGAVTPGNGNALNATLQAAAAQLDRGNTTAAANQLDAFINKATAMSRAGQLPADVAQNLIAAVSRILTSMSSP